MGQAIFSGKPSASYLADALVAIEKAPKILEAFESIHGDIQRVKRTIPSLVTTARFAGTLSAYYALIGTTGVVLQCIQLSQTYELIDTVKRIAGAQEAMVALKVPTKFAQHVYDKVAYEVATSAHSLEGKKNVYFIFHPDNTWHPEFFKLNKRRPLGDQFCGFSDDLAALCLWMRFVRILLSEVKRNNPDKYQHGDEVFHLIIPAYSPVCYDAPIKFSEELYPVVIHGDVFFNRRFVQLNVPDADPGMLNRIDNSHRETGILENWLSPAPEPVVLGRIPAVADRAARQKMIARSKRKRYYYHRRH